MRIDAICFEPAVFGIDLHQPKATGKTRINFTWTDSLEDDNARVAVNMIAHH